MTDVDAALLAALLRESMAKGQQPNLKISSDSMYPLLERGDVIILESVTLEQIRPGDLLTITTDLHLLTHRYYGQQNSTTGVQLLTRGDRLLLFDQPRPTACLIGRVTARRRQDKVLSLQRGRGRWLNRQLGCWAQIEVRSLQLGPQQAKPSLGVYGRLRRRLLWFSAKWLTKFIDSIN
jgi:hypothetical protein